ncbi:MAG: hypothetical protein K2W94_07605 [Alphaproteobacteria bacterium]|nr:hypothetical protein [Alphaproteobacteria bacterium]
MKKVLLTAALLLASSTVTVMAASMAPEAAKTVDKAAAPTVTAAPAMAAAPRAHHHKFSHMSKDDVVAHLKEKAGKVSKDGASLTGVDKELFDAAMTRFNAWISTIEKFADKDTNPTLSAKRAKHELRVANVIAHHKNGYPTESIAKWKAKFDEMKAGVSKLTGDTKAVADTSVSNIENAFAAVEKAKETTLLSSQINALKYEIEALKGVLHHAEHHAHKAAMVAPAGGAMPHDAAKDAKPADVKTAEGAKAAA